MLRGREGLESSWRLCCVSYSIIHIKMLHYKDCDLLLQVNWNSHPRGSELLFAASNQEPALRR